MVIQCYTWLSWLLGSQLCSPHKSWFPIAIVISTTRRGRVSPSVRGRGISQPVLRQVSIGWKFGDALLKSLWVHLPIWYVCMYIYMCVCMIDYRCWIYVCIYIYIMWILMNIIHYYIYIICSYVYIYVHIHICIHGLFGRFRLPLPTRSLGRNLRLERYGINMSSKK